MVNNNYVLGLAKESEPSQSDLLDKDFSKFILQMDSSFNTIFNIIVTL